MIVSFTGTRAGMSIAQAAQLRAVLRWLKAAGMTEFRHGDADGADKEADRIALDFLSDRCVTAWPPLATDKTPLDRDRRDLALPCDVLIAAPLTDKETLRSGTFATVRYARRYGKPIIMLSRGEPL